LDAPFGGVRLDSFKGATSAAIAINDKTRPVPHAILLPPLLERLRAAGISRRDITLVVASGTHPPMTPDEYPRILPDDIVRDYRIVSHDCEDTANLDYLGVTARGTPVYINSRYMAADLHLVVGNIEPHQFMGFSGGVKSAAIGLAGKQTINSNHAMMMAETARLDSYEDNPARQDVEEIGRLLRVDFALNALLNGEKKIVDALAGDPVTVMEAGIPRVRAIFRVPVGQPFDLTIASPGGHPKDINLYQSQKALAHASLITRPGGAVILTAACPEGTGSQSYETWMMRDVIDSHQSVFDHFSEEGFKVGPHKAYQISRDAVQRRVLLISEMPPDFVRKLLLEPAETLENALAATLDALPPGARIGVLPAANATIPFIQT
jgi:nickel-dependent lactate racemase